MTAPAAVPEPDDWRILVAAHEHPDHDEWVTEQAQAEAERSGLTLGAYLGREDALGPLRTPELCCHVFAASKPTT
ncbi:hypothetical protein [Micromonospora tarensis]|uniref:Uncharacterized protein n=1 Tax=Micromonospora tarensis TaxID=2806100 RepID=A0ABS1YDQ3_9ACTN|nr:hypothetical protein [Micromonospora tarensis]MBM0275341.1 hypothetical protein [Micromonospora tarensis]